jgi:uncharacterized phage-associated protein
MPNADAVAKYILETAGPMSAMKLQKLLYYSQAWSLVWDDVPLFPDRIEAWANGPVVREVYLTHRGRFIVEPQLFERYVKGELSQTQKETVDAVVRAYGGKSAQWLSDQTHSEEPWKQARVGLEEQERGEAEITLESMADYYASL